MLNDFSSVCVCYLLMFHAANVRVVGVAARARHLAQLTAHHWRISWRHTTVVVVVATSSRIELSDDTIGRIRLLLLRLLLLFRVLLLLLAVRLLLGLFALLVLLALQVLFVCL